MLLWKHKLIIWIIRVIESMPSESLEEKNLIKSVDICGLKDFYDKRLMEEDDYE